MANHMDVFVILKHCRCGRRKVWHCGTRKWCCSGGRRTGRTGAVSHLGIWQHSDYPQWHAVTCPWDIPAQTSTPPPPCVTLRMTSAPLFGITHAAAHLLCDSGNVTRLSLHWGQRAQRFVSLSHFRIVWGEWWLIRPTVSFAMGVAGLGWSLRWRILI